MMGRTSLSRSAVIPVAIVIAVWSVIGSAKPSTGKKCSLEHDVAIIGAGISGAYTAFKLRNEGLDIGLYEYSDRIGGRFYTENLPDVPDQNLELGGMRLVNKVHVLLQALIKELNLTEKVLLQDVGREQPYEDRVFRRNVSMTVTEFSTGDIPYNLTEEEKANQPDLLRYLFSKLTGDPLDNVTAENVFDLTVPDGRKLYELSTLEALSLVASPEGLAYLLDGNHFNTEENSAANMLYYYFNSHGQVYTGDDVLTVEEGFTQIVESAVRRFLDVSPSHSIEMNTKLLSIRGKAGDYRLKFQRTVTVDDKTMELHGRFSEFFVCAKRVVLALPKLGLSRVDWKPLRSRKFKDLMEGTFLVHASKVFLTYQSPWWLDLSRYPTNNLVASGLGEVYNWGQSSVTGLWTLLVSYTDLVATDTKWVTNNGLEKSVLADSIGGTYDQSKPDPVLVEPDSILPRIKGSVYGENRVTAPLKETLHNRLAQAFGIPRCGIPEPESSIARFWIKYPFGGGWVLTRPGYRYDELISGFRQPSKIDDVFVVGSDYSVRDISVWGEGALWTVEAVLADYFNIPPGL